MAAAPLPSDELERLATLRGYDILDTAPEQPFDRLVQLAAEHFGVPISLVSLVDEQRQWFKSVSGLDVTETSREMAFCGHAILRPDEVMVIENAVTDSRFADNPLVLGDPSIRFYAGAPIRAENGQPLGTLCVIDTKPRQLDEGGRRFLANLAASAGSLLELHRKNIQLSATSGSDPLTGLANRRIFDATLAAACVRAADGVPFGLLVLDLDHFKAVNDQLGHEVGDNLLREVAQRLTQVVRGRDLVARLGGDEFAVIAAGPIDLVGLGGLARRIFAAFTHDMPHESQPVSIHASIGIALAPLHGADPRQLSRAADIALYRGKRGGRQAITIASMPEDVIAPVGSSLEDELLQAIAEETLALHWQPYFCLRTDELVGYEALLRWDRPGRTAIAPMDTIALAEKGGFIAALDTMVMRRACKAAASWPQPLAVSVNLSAWWFNTGDVVGLVSDAVTQAGLSPHRLTIELTEGTLVSHTEPARQRIIALNAMGVRIALDDFGTGYASLGYLCSFDFDIVKLDRSFVKGLGNNPRAEAVAQAVISLGRALRMSICAEGVETAEQLAFLRHVGCDAAQGFLLGRPQSAIVWPEAACVNSSPAAVAQSEAVA